MKLLATSFQQRRKRDFPSSLSILIEGLIMIVGIASVLNKNDLQNVHLE